MRILKFLPCCVLVLVSVGRMFAAEHRGVVKFGGLPLPGASVTAAQGEKKLSAITDAQGNYSFADLADGVWRMRVEMLCFEPAEQDVTVKAGEAGPQWELKLLPFETIQASAPPPPPPPPVSTTLVTQSAAPAPAQKKNSRSRTPAAAPANTASAFQRAEANAAPDAARAQAEPAPAAAPSAAEPSQAPSDGLLINGSVNNGASSPFAQSAAFGNNRRGARSLYSGSFGVVLNNAILDARSFSLTGQDTPKPGYSRVQGNFSFGGPIKIPRLIPRNGPNLTVNYQWLRNRNANVQSTRVPTLLERAGDLSRSFDALGRPVVPTDPTTGLPFANAVIPLNRISPQSATLLGFYPLPNFDAGARYNYQIPLVGSMHQDSLQSRVNKNIGRKNSVNGGLAFQSTRSDTTNLFGFLDTTKSLGLNTTVNWMHRFTPRMFTTLGYQFSRFSSRSTPFFSNRVNVSGQAGITGNNQEAVNWGPPNLNFSSGIAGLSDIQISAIHNQTNGFSGSIFWSHNAHNITTGVDVKRLQFNTISQENARGSFTFTGQAAGSDIAGFLLGIPDTSAIAFGNADKYFRSTSIDMYFQDDWRASPALTVNWGGRWEYSSPITELYGRLVNLDVANGFSAVAPVLASSPTGSLTGQHYSSSLMQPDRTGIEPRVGISWRPFLASSMVVRAGYGVYYDTSVYQAIAIRMAQQSPLSKSLSVQNSAANPLTMANGFFAPPNVITNTFAVDPNFRIGYSQNWQASVQRDLPHSLVMIATYAGVKGTRAQQQFLPNTYPTGANPCGACPTGFTYLVSNGNSTRESGSIQLRRRLHNGLTAQLQYTYAHSIDDALLGGRNSGAAVIAQDWLNLRGERGRSNFDQRHLLNLQGQYTTGMGLRGGTLLSGWKGALYKDWTISTQVNIGSGLPLTPIYLAAVRGTGVTGSIRPDYTGASIYDAPSGFFLNSAAVAPPRTGQWGNAGRNSITGPGQFTLNASMARTFRFSDRLSGDLRIDANNALNHVTWQSWNAVITSAQFGLPTAANQMRSVQLSMRVRY